ncbi:MAG: hypothetical protein EBU89_04470 [Actinobacteria bacterium]|nr:hypothetical protein [Actinomycetota bacterium]
MTGVVHPVGPEEPQVYWRRRLMLGLAALVTLIVIIQSITGGKEPVPAVASGAPSSEALVTSSAPSPVPSVVLASPTTAVLQPTAQPTVPVVADGECSDADTSIRVEVDRETTAVGEGVHIKMIVKNISNVTCKRDVGSGANEVTVISGPALIWSTDHCNPSTDKDLVELAPGQEWSVNVVWIGKQTAKGCKVRNMAEPGAYWAHGRNASLNSDGVRFVVQ